MKKIFITPRSFLTHGKEYVKQMEDMGYEVIANDTGKQYSREEFVKHAKEATGIVLGVEKMDSELLSQCKNLRVIVKYGVGIDNIDFEYARGHDIIVDRCACSNSQSVAEMAIGFMFAMAKHIPDVSASVKNGGWERVYCMELMGKTIGVVGFGDIGTRVAKMAHGIGMNVLASATRPIPMEKLQESCAENVTLDEILERSDVISLNVPLTDKTRNMIGKEQFKKMKNTAILVNTARGGVVNEKDLLEALKEGQIAACATDVFTSEPPVYEPWVKELLALDNFVLTPHMASRTVESDINVTTMCSEKLIGHLKRMRI